MGTTLKKLTSDLKNLQIGEIDGANVLLNGIQLLVKSVDSPWIDLVDGIFPPASVVTELLQTIHQKRPNLDPNTCMALVIQQAYLEVLQTTLKQEKGTLEARFDLDNVNIDEQWRKKLFRSVEKLKECEIDVTRVNFLNLHNEPLVKDHFECLTTDWLRARLFREEDETDEAVNLARRISYQLYPQLLHIVAEHGEFYAPLVEYVKTIDFHELHKLHDIGKYRAALMKLSLKPVFHETFALRDLYVELNANDMSRLRQGGLAREKEKTGQLMKMVLDQLDDREHVVFIQAEPGKGKTVFCHMLAARVAVERPDWIPVFIRLRDESFVIEEVFEESFKKYLHPHFTLTDNLLRNRRFLFILDGIDELELAADTNHSLKSFFEQLSVFQKKCTEENRWRHKLVVTSRTIQNIESDVPSNFLCLQIENMGNPQFVAWLSNWTKLFGEKVANEFRTFLDRKKVFEESEENIQSSIRKLASEPLLLYMLGAMYRDGVLTQEAFETSPHRIEIYNRFVSWVCGDTRKYQLDPRSNRILEKSGLTPYGFRQLLQEIALCVWHGGKEFVPTICMRDHLSEPFSKPIKKLIAAGFDGIHNRLATFSFRHPEGASEKVEFAHKSFGEYLAAEQMVESLRQNGDPHHFYSVFGAALLSDEIRNFVMNILTIKFPLEEVKQITEQLYHLYIHYSDGRWMNEGITRAQWDELKRDKGTLDLLRFEAQTGINLFVLLCLLYQQTGGIFEICGRENDGTFESNRFRKLLAFGEFVETFGLFRRIHHLLKKVSLRRANLLCANFRRADLQETNLQEAVLRDVNLRGANLQGANLQGADLRTANLQDANLQGASLQNANLEDADLRDADFQKANLLGANLLCADLRDADLCGATLQSAVLYGANLHGTILEDADLTGAIISKQHLASYRDLFSETQLIQLDVVQD